MDTGRYCAYNVTRDALLSERVLEVQDALAPEQLLPLLLNGPGMDRRDALWLKEIAAVIKAPRLFGYEVLYLDEDQRIAEVAAIGPAKEFPAVGETVRSVLVIHDRRAIETGTVAGDQVRVCGEAELAALLRTTPQSSELRTEVEPSQRIPVSQNSVEQIFSPEFVFQPFAGSLVYMPDGGTSGAHTSEVFLAFKSAESDVEGVSPPTARSIEVVPVESSTEPIEADLKVAQEKSAGILDEQKERERDANVPHVHDPEPVTHLSGMDPKEVEEKGAGTIPDRQKKQGHELDAPHFHRPEPIRFFDPVTASESEDAEGDLAAHAAEGPRHSTHLSPELKDAIWRIDEQLRRDKEERKDQGRKREKKPKEKKRKAPKGEPTKLFETPVVPRDREMPEATEAVHSLAAETPQVEAGQVEERPIELKPVETEPITTPGVPSIILEPEVAIEQGAEIEETRVEVAPFAVPAIILEPEEVIDQAAQIKDPEGDFTPAVVSAITPPPEAAIEQGSEIEETKEEVAPFAVPAIILEPEEVIEQAAQIKDPQGDITPAVVSAVTPPPEAAIEQPRAEIESVPAPPVFTPAPVEAPPVIRQRMKEQPAKVEDIEDRRIKQPSLPKARPVPAVSKVFEPIVTARSAREEPVREIVEPEVPVKKKSKKKPEKPPSSEVAKPSLGIRLQRLLSGESNSLSGNRRRGERVIVPGLVAYYWSGGAPKAHEIINISRTGFYLRTSDVWSPETLVQMTLQRPKQDDDGQRKSIGVLARVVRIDENGVGHEFVTTEDLHRVRTLEILPAQGTSRKDLQKFLEIK